VTKPVLYSAEALSDFEDIFEWIADAANVIVAQAYVDRLHEYCQSFALFPERGTRRPDIRSGMRTIGFRRRATIAFVARESDVLILRFAHRGRDIGTLFIPEDN
jgi:toxin ParE1/3/4